MKKLRFCERSYLSELISVIIFFLTFTLSAQSVRINELMAVNNSSITDEDRDYSDWIEIYNFSSVEVNLTDFGLTDDNTALSKWTFPNIRILPDKYILIFASGKDRSAVDGELHANFKLSGSGEYLAFTDADGNVVQEFNPSFPVQSADISFGYFDNDYFYSAQPTPGMENQFSTQLHVPAPSFSKKHGFYYSSFNLEIFSDLNEAVIFYTIDGSEPDSQNGLRYTAPLEITTTTVLRAVSIINDEFVSRVSTATYLFLEDVRTQSNNHPGYPVEWGPYTAMEGNAIGDYEMDLEILNNIKYRSKMVDALLAIPSISIVTKIGNLFSHSTDPDEGGIYIYTGPPEDGDKPGMGDGWERSVSIEFFNEDLSEDFQIDCGLRIHGGHSRRTEKTPKHSFRAAFRAVYGQSNLNYPLFKDASVEEFNTFNIRGTYGNSWNHMNHSERKRTQLIRDLWAKDTQLEMGHPSGHGNYVHLYLNGLYWGIYNPTERIDKSFAASYLGGDKEDYDVVKDYGSIVDGDITAWNRMFNIVRSGINDNKIYQQLQGKNPDGTLNPEYEPYLDVVNFTDYMILNFYGENWDWDQHNWIAVRNRVNPYKGFKFFSWDAEHILENVSANILNENNYYRPSELFQLLVKNSMFKRFLADRLQKHFFNGGAFTKEKNIERWMKRANQIDLAIIAESARWGDYRRDVHRVGGPYYLYDKDFWMAEQNFIVNDYFPNRGTVFIEQCKEAGLFPSAEAPVLLINDSLDFSNIRKYIR